MPFPEEQLNYNEASKILGMCKYYEPEYSCCKHDN